jgi:hypothetical protein
MPIEQKTFCAGVGDNGTLSAWKTYTNACECPNVIGITENAAFLALTGQQGVRRKICFCYQNNGLKENCLPDLRSGKERVKGLFCCGAAN